MELEERLTALQEETLVWEAVLEEEQSTLQVRLVICSVLFLSLLLC